MNIIEILKNEPYGITLYSPLCGDCTLIKVSDTEISVMSSNTGEVFSFYSDGRYTYDGECVLFPSKDNRDWSSYVPHTVPAERTFKPFDKVLVRDDVTAPWCPAIYGYYDDSQHTLHPHVTTAAMSWRYCIPYDGNEHLLGTNADPC